MSRRGLYLNTQHVDTRLNWCFQSDPPGENTRGDFSWVACLQMPIYWCIHLKIGYKAQRAIGAPYIDVSRLVLVCWAHCSVSASGLTREETIDGWISDFNVSVIRVILGYLAGV